MRNLDSAYERFGAFVCEKRDWASSGMDFAGFCRESGVDPAALDSLLVGELGMTGEEILETLRKEKVESGGY